MVPSACIVEAVGASVGFYVRVHVSDEVFDVGEDSVASGAGESCVVGHVVVDDVVGHGWLCAGLLC